MIGLFAVAASAAAAQERPITLADAVAEARAGSQDVQAARARADAARQGARAAGSFLWPTIGAEAGAVRSDDPVAAFGGRLRQGRFSQADFDPLALNHPAALTDWSGALGTSWAPVDFSADAGWRAARADADAAGLGARWAERAAAFRAEVRYLEAVGAVGRLAAADAALAAAEANQRTTSLRRDQGMLTDADVLQARAALEGARAQRIDAERGVRDARARLGLALGWSPELTPVPVDTAFTAGSMAETDTQAGSPATGDLSDRADLLASSAQVRASEARVVQAGRARLPRVEGFARLETHSMEAFSTAQHDWLVGFQVRVPLFTGMKISSMRHAAASMRDAAVAEHESRSREAEAEVRETRRGVGAARSGSAAARAASEAASEAARLMRRRFEEGLATTSDLLGAEARAAQLDMQAVNARLGLHIAVARLAFLTDTTNDDLDEGMDR